MGERAGREGQPDTDGARGAVLELVDNNALPGRGEGDGRGNPSQGAFEAVPGEQVTLVPDLGGEPAADPTPRGGEESGRAVLEQAPQPGPGRGRIGQDVVDEVQLPGPARCGALTGDGARGVVDQRRSEVVPKRHYPAAAGHQCG